MRFAVLALLICSLVNALPGEVAPDKWGESQGMGGRMPPLKGGVTKIYDGGKGGGVGGSVGNIGIGNGNACDTNVCDTQCKNAGFQSGFCEGGSSGLLGLDIIGQNGICVCVSGTTTCSTTTTTTATTCSTTSTATASTTTTATVTSTSTAFTTGSTTTTATVVSTSTTTATDSTTITATKTSTTTTTTRTTTTATATATSYCLCCTRQTPGTGVFGNKITGTCYTNPGSASCPLPGTPSGENHLVCCDQTGSCTQLT